MNTYPEGKLNETDEGALTLLLSVEGNCVRVDFPKPVHWFALPPDQAIQLAHLMIAHAEEAKKAMS